MDKRNKPFGRRRKRKDREFDQVLVDVARVARVMKGGRRFGFRATIVIGNRKGKVAMGVARGADVTLAVNKAVAKAKKNFIQVPLLDGTIPHEIKVKYGGAVVFLKPAPPGTGIIAGGGVRAVAEMAGVKDLLSKMLGSTSKVNNVRATLKAFALLETPKQIADKRGKDVSNVMPARFKVATQGKPEPAAKPVPTKSAKPVKRPAK